MKLVGIHCSHVAVLLALTACLVTSGSAQQQVTCTRLDYEKCIKIADPLMKDPHLIFPDNMDDIDLVCRRWSQFVDCVKRYTDKCFTETRRQDFNKAIASPVDSVHQMCTDSNYQKEYLLHATCIKSTLIKDEHCGRHYKHLVEQVAGEVSRVTLCCSHHRFRECVLSETKRACDGNKDGGTASRFSRQILDKALSFIKDQCYNYIPSSGYCPGIALPGIRDEAMGNAVPDLQHGQTNSRPGQQPWYTQATGSDKRVTSSAETMAGKPWLPNTRTTEDRAGRDKWTQSQGTSRMPAVSEGRSTSAWLPTHTTLPPSSTPMPLFHAAAAAATHLPPTPSPSSSSEDNSRPSSFGRGMSWTPASNTEQPADWLQTKTWKVTSQDDVDPSREKHKTDTWRPKVAGFGGGGLSNQVDEPNQQGLANKNEGSVGRCGVFVLVVVAAAVALGTTL